MTMKDQLIIVFFAVLVLVGIGYFRIEEAKHFKYLVICPNSKIEAKSAHISKYGVMSYYDAQGDRFEVGPQCIIKVQDDRNIVYDKNSEFPYTNTYSCNQECLEKGKKQKKKDDDDDAAIIMLMMMSS